MADQSSSDPLPFVQVDRAALPAAALLAAQLGVTVQHGIGTLYQWWQLCGDPRELERIILETPEGQDPEVVLTHAEAELRICLAAGRPPMSVKCEVLKALNLVEDRGEEHVRVRGMSRMFGPVLARIRAREKGSKGGLASAESRRATMGTAQPGGSAPAQAETEAGPKQTPKLSRSTPEAGAEAHRTLEVRGHRQNTTPLPPFAGAKGGVRNSRSRKRGLRPPPAATTRPQMPDTPAGRLWGSVLDRLEADGKTYASEWLYRCMPAALDGDPSVLEIECPDDFFVGWAKENYSPLVDEYLRPLGHGHKFTTDAARTVRMERD